MVERVHRLIILVAACETIAGPAESAGHERLIVVGENGPAGRLNFHLYGRRIFRDNGWMHLRSQFKMNPWKLHGKISRAVHRKDLLSAAIFFTEGNGENEGRPETGTDFWILCYLRFLLLKNE
jgi:hypothetical protein